MTIKPLFALSIFPAENPTNILTAELSKLSLQEPKALEQPKLHLRGGRRKKKRDRNLPPWIVIEFDRYFGDASKLENWQRLCKDLSVDPIPVSVTQCRKALKEIWVNIYDFLANNKNGRPQTFYPNRRALADYTRRNREKIFPKKWAKEGGPVRDLLALIFD